MTQEAKSPDNMFLSGSLPSVFAKTAAPIVLIMLVNGSFTLVDAYFLGAFVGPEALTAVTLMFPFFMMNVALSTLVSNGFSSVIARLLGAGEKTAAHRAFAQAISLALIVCLVLIILFAFGGRGLALSVAKGSQELADLGYTYISILIYLSPLNFILSINGDTLRAEGRIALMAAISLSSVLLNVVFNYVFIVEFEWGVAGSAYGTVLAQAVSIAAIAVARKYGTSVFQTPVFNLSKSRSHWADFLKLGAPTSLSYVGISLSAGVTLYSLQVWGTQNYDATVGAYGIITRLMTFNFLPLLGLSMAFQTVVGNNYGAQKWLRTNASMRLALLIAFIYCAGLQLAVYFFKSSLGGIFVDDAAISAEVARLLPMTTMTFFIFGPLLMISTFFQAIGDAKRSAILSLTRTYAFALPLTFALPFLYGEWGIWYAGPTAEVLMLLLTIYVLYLRAKRQGSRLGLFFANA